MSFNDILLHNGASTPVLQTFKAKALVDGRWTYWNELPGVAQLGYPSITERSLLSKSGNGATKHEINFKIPVLDTSSTGSTRVGRFHAVSVVVTTADAGTAAERADLLAYVKNYFASEPVHDLIVNIKLRT